MFEFKCLPFKTFKFKCLKVKTLSSIQMLRAPNLNSNVNSDFSMESFHSRGQHLYKFIETKENVSIRKEFNSHRIVLVHQHDRHFIVLEHQHGRRFIVLEHQYGRRDVMWKRSKGDSIGHFRVAWSFCFKARLRAKLWYHWHENDYLFSYPGGTPGNSWWGCAARFSKSWPFFGPKNEIFRTRFQTRPLKSIPFSDLATKQK